MDISVDINNPFTSEVTTVTLPVSVTGVIIGDVKEIYISTSIILNEDGSVKLPPEPVPAVVVSSE